MEGCAPKRDRINPSAAMGSHDTGGYFDGHLLSPHRSHDPPEPFGPDRMKAQQFAAYLSQVARDRSHGRDEWRAECPSCHRLSLGFTDGKNGLIVGCSWAVSDLGRHGVMVDGCDPQTIAAALGFTLLDFLNPELRAGVDRDTFGTAPRGRRKSSGRRVWYLNSANEHRDGSTRQGEPY